MALHCRGRQARQQPCASSRPTAALRHAICSSSTAPNLGIIGQLSTPPHAARTQVPVHCWPCQILAPGASWPRGRTSSPAPAAWPAPRPRPPQSPPVACGRAGGWLPQRALCMLLESSSVARTSMLLQSGRLYTPSPLHAQASCFLNGQLAIFRRCRQQERTSTGSFLPGLRYGS